MKRVIVVALIGAALFLSVHRAASAMAEFCPATLHYERVGAQSAKDEPGDLYGFNLSALGPRTITAATLAFDTSGGWYTLSVPPVALGEKDRHYSGAGVRFVRRDYVSAKLYVRFPQAVNIDRAWVFTANAQNDGPFGWQAQGNVACDPPGAPSPAQATRFPKRPAPFYTLAQADTDGLTEVPVSSSVILAAARSKPLENSTCADAFREATVKTQAVPQYPDVMRGQVSMPATVSVEVAIKSDGSLADAWVWGPSGFAAFDDAALRAAKLSTYQGARSYCRAVPGAYFFRVNFDPN